MIVILPKQLVESEILSRMSFDQLRKCVDSSDPDVRKAILRELNNRLREELFEQRRAENPTNR